MLEACGLRTAIECGQQEDIAVVRYAGSAEMRVTEPVDRRIRVVIARATIPACEPRVGTELDHPERNDRTRERMTMTTGADEWIDVAREITLPADVKRK